MLKYTNGQPVERGDIVHIKNTPYIVHDFNNYVYVKSMDEKAIFKHVFPRDIGAYWERVHPVFSEVLRCFP